MLIFFNTVAKQVFRKCETKFQAALNSFITFWGIFFLLFFAFYRCSSTLNSANITKNVRYWPIQKTLHKSTPTDLISAQVHQTRNLSGPGSVARGRSA
jgi:hypothetical protein